MNNMFWVKSCVTEIVLLDVYHVPFILSFSFDEGKGCGESATVTFNCLYQAGEFLRSSWM